MTTLKGMTSQSIANSVSIIFDILGTTKKNTKYRENDKASRTATIKSTTFFESSTVNYSAV